MRLTRREFAATSLGILGALSWRGLGRGAPGGWAGLLALAEPEASENYFDWRPVRDDLWVASKGGGNCLAIRAGDQSALIDTKNPGWGDTLRREAEALVGRVKVVINTHHHADHIGGNPSFKKDVTILAHGRAARRAIAGAEQAVASLHRLSKQLAENAEGAPARVVDEVKALADRAADIKPLDFTSTVPLIEYTDIAVGNLSVQMHHKGAGHTDNDIFVHLPQKNVLHTGDLVFHKLHPYMDVRAGANSRGWQKSVQAMIEVCNDDTIVIPGHGEPTNVAGLREQIAYFDTLRDIVSKARADGMTRDQVTQLRPEPFKSYGFENLLPNNLGVLFDELESEAAG